MGLDFTAMVNSIRKVKKLFTNALQLCVQAELQRSFINCECVVTDDCNGDVATETRLSDVPDGDHLLC